MLALDQAVASVQDDVVRCELERSLEHRNAFVGSTDYEEHELRFFSGGNWFSDEQIMGHISDYMSEVSDAHPAADVSLKGNTFSVKLRDGRTLSLTVTIA